MVIVLIASAFVAAGVGTGLFISKKRFDNNLSDVENTECSKVGDDSLKGEIGRYEQLKVNLLEVKKNVESLDIPTPEPLSSYDDAESSLNKLSAFFEHHSKSFAGTESFILSILPVSQTGEALWSFAEVAPDLVSDAFSNSLSALKDGAVGIDDIGTCLNRFCEGMASTSPQALGRALQHHDYIGGLFKPIKSGIVEVTGINDAASSLTESVHDMGNALSNAAELSIDPTDLTDLDVSGHIPVITIAISSFREFNLLMDNKTDALTSLKNIGLDAAGAGGGGLVGAKAGALAGSIFGPVGSLLGGVVGGIAGAMGGRALTNNIKQMPLKNAIEAYQTNITRMKSETREKSRLMLQTISNHSNRKRTAFKEDRLLKDIPVVENENTVVGIAVIMYHSVVEHIDSMKEKVHKLQSSFWYSESKYSVIVDGYNQRIDSLERQLPSVKNIEKNPQLALEALLALDVPNQKKDPVYRSKYLECTKELKEMNDKNNSSILVWSYMVNGLYQKTLNEIAEFANNQMTMFNQFVDQWKQTMASLENKVKVEKGKLGIK